MERARPIGVCALCLRTAELCDSHLVPKSLYRVARAADHRAHPDPVLLTSTVRRQTSFQATQYLLCAECQKRFDQNGEDWVMRHCYRGRDRFRLRELLGGPRRFMLTRRTPSSTPQVSREWRSKRPSIFA
jgi:hypothetical protein